MFYFNVDGVLLSGIVEYINIKGMGGVSLNYHK